MPQGDIAWLRYQQRRWMRPDAVRWLRQDAARFLKPGTDQADVYPALHWFEEKGRSNQPRVPSGNPFGGRWTRDGDGGGTSASGVSASSSTGDGTESNPQQLDEIIISTGSELSSGHDLVSGLSSLVGSFTEILSSFDDAPPEIPREEPATRRGRMGFVRSAAAWIARIGRRMVAVDIFFRALDEIGEIDRLASMIKTANDPPQDFDEAKGES